MPSPSEILVLTTYLGSLGRAPEHEGFVFWTERLATLEGEMQADDAAARLILEMNAAAQAHNEAAAWSQGDEAYVTSLYQSLLGRTPDADGLAFWMQLLEDGTTREHAFLSFMNSAQSSEESAFLANRLIVAEEFAKVENSGPDVLDTLEIDAYEVVAGVTADPATVEAAKGLLLNPPVDETPAPEVPAEPEVPVTPPVTPPAPPPAPTFSVELTEQTVSFHGTAEGSITADINEDGVITFSIGNLAAEQTFDLATGSPAIVLAQGQVLSLTMEQSVLMNGGEVAGAGKLIISDAISLDDHIAINSLLDLSELTGEFQYDIEDSLSTLFAARESDAVLQANSLIVSDGALGDGSAMTVANATAMLAEVEQLLSQATLAEGVEVDVLYTLSDSILALANADADVLSGAESYAYTDEADVQLGTLSAVGFIEVHDKVYALFPDMYEDQTFPELRFTLEDTLGNLITYQLLIGRSDGYVISDPQVTVYGYRVSDVHDMQSTISNLVANALNEEPVVPEVWYSMYDTAQNLLDNPDVLADAASYSFSEKEVSIGENTSVSDFETLVQRVDALFAGSEVLPGFEIPVPVYVGTVEDTYLALIAADPALLALAPTYTISDEPGALGELNVANAKIVAGAVNATDYTYSIRDDVSAFIGEQGDLSTATRVEGIVTGEVDISTVELDSDMTQVFLSMNSSLTVNPLNLAQIDTIIAEFDMGIETMTLRGEGVFDFTEKLFVGVDVIKLDPLQGDLTVVTQGAANYVIESEGSVTIQYTDESDFGTTITGFDVESTVLDLTNIVATDVREVATNIPGGIGLTTPDMFWLMTTPAGAGVADDPALAATFIEHYSSMAFSDSNLELGEHAYFVVQDDNSSAVYEYTAGGWSGGNMPGIHVDELMLIARIDAVGLTADNFLVGDPV